VRAARARLDAALLRLAALEAAQSAADDANRLVQERHQEGLATTLELTEAENALTRTRLAAASARHELALARSAVALAAGTLELPETRP
jgi:outer membrane protein TolC